MFERWNFSLPITLNTPIGVGWPRMPVETGDFREHAVFVVNFELLLVDGDCDDDRTLRF